MKHLKQISSKDELEISAKKFLDILLDSKERKIAFSGEMGAGKTTFISSLLKVMRVDNTASSPTFSIVDEHYSSIYGTIYHFDFYRIENEEEVYDIGIEEYLSNDSFCFMEWPEKVENVLRNQCLWVNLSESQGIRTLDFDL